MEKVMKPLIFLSLLLIASPVWAAKIVRNSDGSFRIEKTYFDCGQAKPCENALLEEINYPKDSKYYWAQAGFVMLGYWENLVLDRGIKNHEKFTYEDIEIMRKLGYEDLIKKAKENNIFRSGDWFKRKAKRDMYGCLEKGMNAEMGDNGEMFNGCWDKNSKSVYANARYSGPKAFACNDKRDCRNKFKLYKNKHFQLFKFIEEFIKSGPTGVYMPWKKNE